jgi:hypothetical protein
MKKLPPLYKYTHNVNSGKAGRTGTAPAVTYFKK